MRPGRFPFVALAMISLIGGLLAGLHRIGWMLPVNAISPGHGAIMVGGFLGTLITLEKIIPLKRRLLFAVPIVSAASVVLFYFKLPILSVAALIIASAGLSVVFLLYWLKERSLIYSLMFAGAVCWFSGNLILLTDNFYPSAVPWWMAFVLFIITSERLELIKFLPVTKQQKALFVGTLATFLFACILSFHGAGRYIASVALIAALRFG
ncbi:MAG: hypothetical protein QM762_25660 [Chryseolinea sp.]